MQGRLRIKNIFGKRPVEPESVDFASVYVISIVEEGKTEEQYFDGIADLNNSGLIKIDRLEKSADYINKSHPNHIIELLVERKTYWTHHGVEPNEFWMVVDRDPKNVSSTQLRDIIDRCGLEKFNLALSNPNFEFWLLLHLTDITDYDQQDLVFDKKINKSRKFISGELSKWLSAYKKRNLEFKRFE